MPVTHHSRKNFLTSRLVCFTVLICTAFSSFVSTATLSQTDGTQSSTGNTRAGADSELKQGVCDFLAKDYFKAQQHFEKALELDPSQKKLPIFIARALDAQFDQNRTEETGKRAIGAWDQIIARNQDNPDAVDKALVLKADIYSRLANVNRDKASEYLDQERETLEKRAALPSATTKTKADVYYTLGVGYWKASYDMNAGYLAKNEVVPREVLDKMKPLNQKAHEYLQKAISIDSNYANAWFYEKLVYIEEMKYSPAKQNELTAKVMEMQDKYNAMQKQQQEAVIREHLPNKKEYEGPAKETIEDRIQAVADRIKDLTESLTFIKSGNYKRESKIDLEKLLTSSLFQTLTLLVPADDAAKDEAERQAKRMAKRPWKPFAPATEEFTVSMPSPTDQSGGFYSAHSEAIGYTIISSGRPPLPSTSPDNYFSFLAPYALSTAKIFDRFEAVGHSDDVAFDVSLVRTLSLNGHPGVQYRLKWTEYCGKSVFGILRVFIANKHIYALYVGGADDVWGGDDGDPRVSKFFESFTIPAQSKTQKSKE